MLHTQVEQIITDKNSENQLNQCHQRSIWRINRTQMHAAYTD